MTVCVGAADVALLDDPADVAVAVRVLAMSSEKQFGGMGALADNPVDCVADADDVVVASTTRPLVPKESSMHFRASAIVVGSERVRV